MSKKAANDKSRRSIVRARKRRRERLFMFSLCAFLALCIGAFASIALLNGRSNVRSGDVWKIENAEMEILAPEARSSGASTLENREKTAPVSTAAPTAQPTLQPTPQPTATPAPTQAPERTQTEITITAVGDCTLGGDMNTGYYTSFKGYADRYGSDYFLANVRALFESDDLTIVNLEGPLTTSNDKRKGRKFNFRGEPEYVDILSGSSVEIANVANNHSLDFGESGFNETCQVLENAGVGVSGFSRVLNLNVKGVRVCSLGFTEWAYTQEQIEKAVRNARESCDLLIVSMHWGEEGSHTPTRLQETLGHAIIDAGADIVIGNHSHVYGTIERYNGKYIVYSLGNFCFGGNRNPAEKDCVVFRQTFVIDSQSGVQDGGIDILPARVSGSDTENDFQPYLLSGERGERLLKKIDAVSSIAGDGLVWLKGSNAARLLSAE
ncbi:MAG: CapA family protein [Clostridia bacterium]|nr:CapA family protein [Clostridia bacterium]